MSLLKKINPNQPTAPTATLPADIQAQIRLAEIELESKKLEFEAKKLELESKKIELQAQEKASEMEVQAKKRQEITNIFMMIGYIILIAAATIWDEVDAILGRPLTCGFALLMAYYFSQKRT